MRHARRVLTLLVTGLLYLKCGSARALCFCLKSADENKPFTLRLELPDDSWDRGTVHYKGSSEKITIVPTGTKELERHEGRPSYFKYSWHELVGGKITGTYVVCIQGANVYESWYIRKKDNKRFNLVRVPDEDECQNCI